MGRRAGRDSRADAITRRGLMLVLSSPSGAGKTTLSRMLLEADPDIEMSISVTTRPPRPGEVDGHDYHFIDTARFDAMVKNNELLEWARVFDNSYGTPRKPVDDAITQGRDVLFDIDWQGTQQLREKARSDIVSVFVLPPSIDELERRLRTRAQDPEEIIQRRMAVALNEMSHWAEYDYVVVNRTLPDTLIEIKSILTAERTKRERQTGLGAEVRRLQFRTEDDAGHIPPELPEQMPGPHFVLRPDGVVDFAPREALDRQGNNIARLRDLHPILRRAAQNLANGISPNHHPHLREIANRYCDLLDRDLEKIPFVQLYGEGLRLESAAEAAERRIADRTLPELEDPGREALDSVITLHGTFILSTREGLELVAAAERYRRKPEEERVFGEAAIALGRQLEAHPEIIAPKAANFIRETAEELGGTDSGARRSVLGLGAARNVTIVILGGATIGLIAESLGAKLGPAFAVVALDGLRKSRSFSEVVNLGKKAWDSIGSITTDDLKGLKSAGFGRYVSFVLSNEGLLRRLTGDRVSLNWLHKHLNWIKLHSKITNSDS